MTTGLTSELKTATPTSFLSPDRFKPFVSERQWEEIELGQERARQLLAGRALFHISSRLRAGGLAELLRSQVACARGLGIDARWEVVDGSPEFFALAKRIHNKLHGQPNNGTFGEEVRFHYEHGLDAAGRKLADRVKPRDVVILHDPQTAGLVTAAKLAGARVVWRCHVGLDKPNDSAREGGHSWSPTSLKLTPMSSAVHGSSGRRSRRHAASRSRR